ncbi:hypothetical protein BD410DRAFT_316142 [Rickenella mellea]|uniref:Glycosyltransferase 2-like domain-containing protein n=1 Tax=Rickenella mellea TaxID=50990 RepID=A0A4Y7Q1B4_9AGAM|nr:hypothetical protein BD410DRAFT_316142 [Rickenella mellea]
MVGMDRKHQSIVFAILLPITSRGLSSPDTCLEQLAKFSESLLSTTSQEGNDDVKIDISVYVAVDADDEHLLSQHPSKPENVLRNSGILHVTTLVCSHPRGHVSTLWRDCARRAWNDGCDYFVLIGDDVVLLDKRWMISIHEEFLRAGRDEGVPTGFGCIALTDVSFPGMPTFPVVHRTHMDIFGGEVVPEVFINQDGNVYLYQLYRRWGCSRMISSRIRNGVGGSGNARYVKQHATKWAFDTLDHSTKTLEDWMTQRHPKILRKLTIDVIVPSYRVQLPLLDGILQLKSSSTCSVMFVIIVDDPNSPQIPELQKRYDGRPDVRIRVNPKNIGASATRNRGMDESAAEWVHFLDDDVVPHPDLLLEDEKIIRAHPLAAGFVGNSQFPPADSVFKTAIHLAGVIDYWNIATKWITDVQQGTYVPWGVTANLIARRNVDDGVKYDLVFPKTGGGEDIDYCLKKHAYFVAHGLQGFHQAPKVTITHPWWNDGRRSYWRYYMWSKGDGALIKLYPHFSFRDSAPNSSELFFLISTILSPLIPLRIIKLRTFLAAPASVVIANVVHDLYRHLWRERRSPASIKSNLRGIYWMIASIESSFIRMASEAGRLAGMLERRETAWFGYRFDWLVGRKGEAPRLEERRKSRERLALSLCFLAMFVTASR